MDPTDTPAWRTFMNDLKSKGIDFGSIQFADDLSRAEVIASVQGLSAVERAMVSSTWARLASPQSQRAASLGGGGNSSSLYNGLATAAATGMSTAGDPSYGFGSPPRSFTGAVACDPTSLRSALQRGDSTVALPLASELLQHDPTSLCLVLHEHLPHMSVDQIRAVLGLGAPTAMAMPQQANQSTTAPPGWASLNGKSLQPGVVLTAQNLVSQFGPGFTATCNGVYLTFPYTVQRGDNIIVRAITDRSL